jgi:hypothetical protein
MRPYHLVSAAMLRGLPEVKHVGAVDGLGDAFHVGRVLVSKPDLLKFASAVKKLMDAI